MYYTDDSILPENMAPLIITAAPYGPAWLPGDAADIPLTWDEQVQEAVDCYEAGATVLHIHVREEDGHGSKRLSKFNELRAPTKERPENKIDGPIAMLMALGRALKQDHSAALDDFLKNPIIV